MSPLIQFVHGKESGPWGRKISYLSEIARSKGFDVESLDYLTLAEPQARADKLVAACQSRKPDILVGSSMGGWVAAMATTEISVRGLFLMAPAFYMPDYPEHQVGCDGSRVAIVHGWHDSVIPYQNSVRFGQDHQCSLLLLDDDHRLAGKLDQIGEYFAAFIQRAMAGE